MGKSYQKFNAQKKGKDRYFSRKKKQSKVSQHGSHCNKKTCTACKRHNIRDCNFSKKYCPSKTKNFLKEKCRLFNKIGVYAMPKLRSLEIDEKSDLDLINYILKKNKT